MAGATAGECEGSGVVSDKSAIHWTDATWNPATGCDRTAFAGCEHCYALDLAASLKRRGNRRYQVDGDPRTSGPGFGLTLHHDVLDKPKRWRDPKLVFVNSMSDLGHPAIPDDFLSAIFDVMSETPRHTYQVLTKRPHRLRAFLEGYYAGREPLLNVWVGTSVAVQTDADRLRRASSRTDQTQAGVAWLRSVAHRRRRERHRSPPNGSGLGSKPPRSMSSGRRGVFLQGTLL